jgi:phospholipid/cholesterol/gamma-HCH transport system substrate-binding protein
MQKSAPTLPKLLTMVVFALTCFGLLLFLWLSFGGPIPLKPKGYRVKVAFPEATQLGLEADVRVAGVSVGKVVKKDVDPTHPNRTVATLQLENKFSPLSQDARAILRQKTLLGETYVELTPGNAKGPKIPEDGWLNDSRVAKTVELDEIFQALDPVTRRAFQNWQQSLAKGVGTGAQSRGRDINDAFGNLPGFAQDATDVLTVLDEQSAEVQRLVKNTGVVFGALNQNEAQLHNLITNSSDVFSATQKEKEALAATFRIFPTFLDESKATFAKLETFSKNTDPLIQQLRPAMRDLKPTLRDTRALAPDLERLFRNLDPLIKVSRTGLPALRDVLNGTQPVLGQLQPFLENLNPILQWLEYNQRLVGDFIGNGAGALVDTVPVQRPDIEVGHYLRQFGPVGPETVAIYPNRPKTNRGNAYLPPTGYSGPDRARRMIFPEFDCANAGGERQTQLPSKDQAGTSDDPSCWTAPPAGYPSGNTSPFPHIGAANYSKPSG